MSARADSALPTEAAPATAASALRVPSAWTGAVVLLGLCVAAYFTAWRDLWPLWENKNATYTHGSLIALVALWLVWRARLALRGEPARPDPRAIVPVVLLSLAWFVLERGNVFLAYVVLWPVLAFTVLWAGIGLRSARAFAFPLAYLYFAIPIWEVLKPALQAISSAAVGLLTSAVGIQALVEGPYITLPQGTVYIALDCSGAHFLSVALAVAVLAGEIRRDALRTRVLIVALAAGLSMVFNWLRIFLIVLAYLNPTLKDALESVGHYTFGWWVFALDLVVFYLALRFVPSSPTPEAPSDDLAPEYRGRLSAPAGYLAAVGAALALPAIAWTAPQGSSYPEPVAAAPALDGLRGPIPADAFWEPTFEGAAWTHRAAYIDRDGRVVELYRNEYHAQSQGKEFAGRGTALFPPERYELSDRRERVIEPGSGRPAIRVIEQRLTDSAGRPWLALFAWYLDGTTHTRLRRVHFVSAVRALYSRPTVGVMAIAAPCRGDCTDVAPSLDAVFALAHAAYARGAESG
jgi:exosortase